VGVPQAGRWRVLLNSDARFYGGSGYDSAPEVWTADVAWHGRPQSIEINLPPLAVLFLQPV
jgi:1,4-alpha-glucan branching enzyme